MKKRKDGKELHNLLADARKAEKEYDEAAAKVGAELREGNSLKAYDMREVAEERYRLYQDALMQIGIYCLMNSENILERKTP